MRMPAPSRTPIPHRRRPTIGASAMMFPPREAGDPSARLLSINAAQDLPGGPPGRIAALRPTDSRNLGRLRLGRAFRPDQPADNFDDDQRDKAAEQHVAEIVAAEGEPQEARAEPKDERSDDRGSAPGQGEHARRRDHPEAARGFAGDERTVHFASAVVVIPGYERVRPVEVLGLDRTGTMPMILEAEVDDEARPDGHRGDEKDHRSAARRPAEPSPSTLGGPQRRIDREHHERRHSEKVAAEALEVVAAEEAPLVVEIARALEVEFGPDRENSERQSCERNVDE